MTSMFRDVPAAHVKAATCCATRLEADPWTTIEERYKPGTRVAGKVRNLTDFGAFVELEEKASQAKPATINRELAALRAAYRLGLDHDTIIACPESDCCPRTTRVRASPTSSRRSHPSAPCLRTSDDDLVANGLETAGDPICPQEHPAFIDRRFSGRR